MMKLHGVSTKIDKSMGSWCFMRNNDVNAIEGRFAEFLWRLSQRPYPPKPWLDDGNLPWNEPAFSERMLREHLDQSHGAASRTAAEREAQLAFMWDKLDLVDGRRVLDMTCGPGLYAVWLAEQGCFVTGVDFSPASIAYARELAQAANVAEQTVFVEQDVRQMDYGRGDFDIALFIYGQLSVFKREEAWALLQKIAKALTPGGKLIIELLNQDKIDKKPGNWWFTDDKGLWGERPFLHLGERFWIEEEKLSIDRFYTLDLETAISYEINLCDQSYAVDEMVSMLQQAGFVQVDVYPAWDGLPLYDANEWIVYIATTAIREKNA